MSNLLQVESVPSALNNKVVASGMSAIKRPIFFILVILHSLLDLKNVILTNLLLIT